MPRTRPAADARDADGWPAAVPVLVAADLAWNFATADGRRDLVEWLNDTFNPTCSLRESKVYAAAYQALCGVLTERLGRRVTVLNLFLEYTHAHRTPSLAWQAACWNEMLRRLGYAVPAEKANDPGDRGKG